MTSRLVSDQTTGHCSLAKMTHEINHHTPQSAVVKRPQLHPPCYQREQTGCETAQEVALYSSNLK